MKEFVQNGSIIDVALLADTESGEVVLKGGIKGVSQVKGAASDKAATSIMGVFRITKDASIFTQGESVYYDDGAKQATSDKTKAFFGIAADDAATGETAVSVILGDSLVGALATKYNALLVKLDGDGGVSELDYASTLSI